MQTNKPLFTDKITTNLVIPTVSVGLSATLLLIFASPVGAADRQTLQGHVPAAVAHLTSVGHLEAARELKLAIGLPLRNQEGLTNLLQRIYDPTSPDYHHYLTPAQFAETIRSDGRGLSSGYGVCQPPTGLR